MLIFHLSVALLAVGALAYRPRSGSSAALVAAIALLDVAVGAQVTPAVTVVVPLLVFLTAALTLAALVEQAGLAERAAFLLAAAARGSPLALYGLACLLCALLTAVVSLDGAVVLMLPLLRVLNRTFRVPFAPLFLGVVAVANAGSIAVPQGNPTNLVLMSRLGLSPQAFLAHMFLPGLGAAVFCAGVVACWQRHALAAARPLQARPPLPFSTDERYALLALAAAALAGWLPPLLGIAPWWPFTVAVTFSLVLRRKRARAIVPWRILVQVAGLVVVLQALAVRADSGAAFTLPALLAVALAVAAASAIVNNLPASVSAATLLAAGPAAYGASIGLAVGALATSHGSVATLLAADLAGPDRPPLPMRRLALLAAAAVVLATLLLWATLL